MVRLPPARGAEVVKVTVGEPVPGVRVPVPRYVLGVPGVVSVKVTVP